MRRKKSLILRLLPWVIVLAALAALIWFVFVPIYSQKDDSLGRDPVVIASEGASGSLKMENDDLLFEMDQASTQFTVTDKKSGKTWYSNPQNRESDPNFLLIWMTRLDNSVATIRIPSRTRRMKSSRRRMVPSGWTTRSARSRRNI